MIERVADMNGLGIVTGAVLSFLLGWPWFSPKPFDTKWTEDVGVGLGSASATAAFALPGYSDGLFTKNKVIPGTSRPGTGSPPRSS